MKKDRVYFDTDVILDVALNRKPYADASKMAMSLAEENFVTGFTSTLILANCYYIISNIIDKKTALKTLGKLRSILKVLPFTDREIGESLNSGFADFEDGIQYFICVNNSVAMLLTRNIRDFKKAAISVMTPAEYIHLKSDNN